MKGLLIMAFIANFNASCATGEPTEQKNSISKIMEKPLITGASVSAGALAPSPGKILALRHTQPKNIKTIAANGRSSLETIAKLTDKDFLERSSVIAIDAFFWDSFMLSPERSLKVLKNLIDRTAKKDIPLVLGEVPLLMPSRQKSALAINREINRACQALKKCYVLPFNSMVQQILRDGFLDINGKKYGLFELLPDGLHVNNIASSYLADRIEKLLVPTL